MDINDLRKQHAQLGEVLEQAEKAGPFNAMLHAKKAARISHDLLGDIINQLQELNATSH
ncbi:hypothetical protein L2750_12855 [Shewanella submarina]|uniref:DUF465 domain-containing protein n=1 Tax=Shewanella submarina TaxID=2016376 RepID=A0ABV7GDQ3_9GAMM|nr:hypothetical protein [Shewanella submarina]MCL1038039.1 hypothetical protein [Shewanella submarina]